MQEFAGKVAVVTGAASGIGFALAERAGQEGMTVVMSDIETGALEAAVEKLRAKGYKAIPHQLDVTRPDEVENRLPKRVLPRGWRSTTCFANNAGVMNAREADLGKRRGVLAVDALGERLGRDPRDRAFVPRMLASGEEGHIVNTASMAGLITGRAGNAVYDASKHACLAISESLYRDLVLRQTKVSASVLCPGAVLTQIFAAERNRPAQLGGGDAPVTSGETAFPNSYPPGMANRCSMRPQRPLHVFALRRDAAVD